MKKTLPGTRALVREHFRAISEENYAASLRMEDEISRRIGPGNAIMLDGKIVSSHKGDLGGSEESYWIFVYDRVGLDNEDDNMPEMETPFDGIDIEEELEIETSPSPEPKKKKTKKKSKKKKTTMVQ